MNMFDLLYRRGPEERYKIESIGVARVLLNTGRHTCRYLCLALFLLPAFPQQDAPKLEETPDARLNNSGAMKDMVPPKLLYKIEPEYTEQARRAGISGRAVLSVVIDVDGRPKDIKAVSPLSNGLAEQAIKAVSKWRFEPGTKDGVPVAVKANVEVNFRLCTSKPCEKAGDAIYERLESARTIYNAGVHQLRGDLDKKDVKAGFDSMQRAASLDYAPAEVALGLIYLKGIGTTADAAKAAEWFDRAAVQGNAQGEYQLGRLHETGNGTKADLPEALRLYLKAAEKNLSDAQCAAGVLLEAGSGVPQNIPEAVKWYRKSAEQGSSEAQYRLAKVYWSGLDGKQDQVKALTWALIASTGGDKIATSAVQEYRAQMTPKQIEAAQREAGRFKPHPATVKQ
jgi:TonB family protein